MAEATGQHQPGLILVTGATGKVGRHFIARLFADPAFAGWRVRALCHNRLPPERERVEILRGSLDDRATAQAAVEGVSHVLHLATTKETPETIIDVAVKGLFWLLEACRESPAFRQFVLIGGDAAIGHFDYPQPIPITEEHRHRAYPGCYALSKVLEEVMLEQYQIQYGLNGCCLRAPWIMAEDDFRYTLTFGPDVFGGPRWCDLVDPETAKACHAAGTVPLLLDAAGTPLKRSFVHVEDLVSAILLALDHPAARHQLFHIAMDPPVDYAEVAAHLKATRGLDSVAMPSPYHSAWMDSTKAQYVLGWRPAYDARRLVDEAWAFRRAPDDPRIVWYPG